MGSLNPRHQTPNLETLNPVGGDCAAKVARIQENFYSAPQDRPFLLDCGEGT